VHYKQCLLLKSRGDKTQGVPSASESPPVHPRIYAHDLNFVDGFTLLNLLETTPSPTCCSVVVETRRISVAAASTGSETVAYIFVGCWRVNRWCGTWQDQCSCRIYKWTDCTPDDFYQ